MASMQSWSMYALACPNWQLRTIGHCGCTDQNVRMQPAKLQKQRTGCLLFGAFGLFLALVSLGTQQRPLMILGL